MDLASYQQKVRVRCPGCGEVLLIHGVRRRQGKVVSCHCGNSKCENYNAEIVFRGKMIAKLAKECPIRLVVIDGIIVAKKGGTAMSRNEILQEITRLSEQIDQSQNQKLTVQKDAIIDWWVVSEQDLISGLEQQIRHDATLNPLKFPEVCREASRDLAHYVFAQLGQLARQNA